MWVINQTVEIDWILNLDIYAKVWIDKEQNRINIFERFEWVDRRSRSCRFEIPYLSCNTENISLIRLEQVILYPLIDFLLSCYNDWSKQSDALSLVTPSKLGLLRSQIIYHELIYLPFICILSLASDDQVFPSVIDCGKSILIFVQLADFPPCIVSVFGNYGCSPICRLFANISTKYKCSWVSRCSCIIWYPENFENASTNKK